MTPLLATYRLQFRNGMSFDRAVEIVPYLKRLGISHLYASPVFAATTGSTHGYDVIDHNRFDPALGGPEGFERLSRTLKDAGLGLVLDIVPNHMAASLENSWWRSVVEWGEQSAYCRHFDIDWSEKLTLPILGRSYGEALAANELAVKPAVERGCLALAYFDNLLPLHPRSYAKALARLDDPLAASIGDCAARAAPDSEERMHDDIRRLLADKDTASRLQRSLTELSRDPGFVDEVHADQPWRLHFWKDARRHLSYRRFFEVTGLVGVRVEDGPVFDDVHRLVLDLVRSGRVDALRIDHVDGLADPGAYLDRLRQEVGPDVPIFVEKILGNSETLPKEWPISGTTGYEFITALAEAMVDPAGGPELDEAYAALSGHPVDLAAREREAKELILYRNFEGELSTLVRIASDITGDDTSEADLTRAIGEMIIAFPVYRTYGDRNGMPESGRELLGNVAADARQWAEGAAGEAVDFVLRVLCGDVSPVAAERAARFRIRFQQLTGPVMAKAVEDTLFYRFNRLIGLNEVGGDPGVAGSLEHFHSAMAERVLLQPRGLLATATHDTKRGEDARARLYAISEAPRLWADAVARWREMNVEAVARNHDHPTPDPETEWLLYQSLAGMWPEDLDPGDGGALDGLRERFIPYVEKALREAKRHTSWTEIDEAYEEAVKAYAGRFLSPANRNFLEDFEATLRPFIRAGNLNSLGQTLIKMTAPGAPDIYQGCESLDLSLVDPDNRRAVDFELLSRRPEDRFPLPEDLSDGLFKQHMIATCLRVRKQMPRLFQDGDYAPLAAKGRRWRHLIAFMRRDADDLAITIAPRLCFDDDAGWEDTTIELPAEVAGHELRNVFTGERFRAGGDLPVGPLLRGCPVAVLVSDSAKSQGANEQTSGSGV